MIRFDDCGDSRRPVEAIHPGRGEEQRSCLADTSASSRDQDLLVCEVHVVYTCHLVPAKLDLVDKKNLFLGTNIEFQSNIYFIIGIVRIEPSDGARITADHNPALVCVIELL